MTTKVRKAEATSERGRRVRSKLMARSAENGRYVSLSLGKQALETKLERLRKETRRSTVEVLSET